MCFETQCWHLSGRPTGFVSPTAADLTRSGFLESRDSPRKHFCRGWLVHIRNKHAETTVELFQAEQVLRAAEATLAERTEALEDIRRAIFEEREVAAGLVPTPPQYIYGA